MSTDRNATMYINTLRANGTAQAVTIPPALRKKLGWNKGDLLILEPGPGNTIIIHSENRLHEFLREQAERRAHSNGAAEYAG